MAVILDLLVQGAQMALVLLLAAVLWPALALPAGLAFSASCLWLEWNLIGAARLYVRFRDKIRAAVSDGAVPSGQS